MLIYNAQNKLHEKNRFDNTVFARRYGTCRFWILAGIRRLWSRAPRWDSDFAPLPTSSHEPSVKNVRPSSSRLKGKKWEHPPSDSIMLDVSLAVINTLFLRKVIRMHSAIWLGCGPWGTRVERSDILHSRDETTFGSGLRVLSDEFLIPSLFRSRTEDLIGF